MSRHLRAPLLPLGLALCPGQARAETVWLGRFHRAMAVANAAMGEAVASLVAAWLSPRETRCAQIAQR